MKFKVSYEKLQEADDGNTTHYGGEVTVNEKEYQARGTDRDTELLNIICEAIEHQLNRELRQTESETVEEMMLGRWPEGFEVKFRRARGKGK